MGIGLRAGALAALAAAGGRAPARADALARGGLSRAWPFVVERATDEIWVAAQLAGEVDWAERDRACALLAAEVDGLGLVHVAVVDRLSEPRRHRLMLGRLAAGQHELRLRYLDERTPPGAGRVEVGEVLIGAAPAGSPLHRRLSHAPVLRAPASVLASDLPVLLYAAEGADKIGDWLEYTVIYTNEDSRDEPIGLANLLSRWGRTVDIEYIYRVWLDAEGRVLATSYQAEGHEDMPFAGVYGLGCHPELWVATANGMVGDAAPGADTLRLALMPADDVMPGAPDRPREWYMLAEPWIYELMVKEMRREEFADGSPKVEAPSLLETPAPGDPTDFVYVAVELGEFRDGHPAVGLRLADGSELWNDRGQMDADTLDRSGWQQVAVELPPGLGPGELAELVVASRQGTFRLLSVGPAVVLDRATLRPRVVADRQRADARLETGMSWTRALAANEGQR